MAIDYVRLRDITSVIQLDAIALAESSFVSHFDFRRLIEERPGTLHYSLSITEAQWSVDGSRLDVALGYRVHSSLLRKQEGDIDLFTTTARFVVAYHLPDPSPKPSSEALADLAAANVQINIFPYLRQLVADLSAKAGWPTLLLKVLRAPAKRPRKFGAEGDIWKVAPRPTL